MESTIADFELGGHIRGRTGSILPELLLQMCIPLQMEPMY